LRLPCTVTSPRMALRGAAAFFARRQRLQHKARLWYDDRTEHLARNHDVQIHSRNRNQDAVHKLKMQLNGEPINPNQLNGCNQRTGSQNQAVKPTPRVVRSDFLSPPPALGGGKFLRPLPATSSDGEGTIDAELPFHNGLTLCKP